MGVPLEETSISVCAPCNSYSIWYNGNILFPESKGIANPNSDLNKEIQADYNEARSIFDKSPRGAAALLRLAIQKMCKQLGENGKDINHDIANLVKKGLPETIQQALDIVRVVGNNAVHPGQIDLKDNSEIAFRLFELINLIAQVMITQPKEIKKLYESLPDSIKDSIKKRDAVR